MFDRDETTTASEARGDSSIPAAYTYFGQFVDHDITFDEGSGDMATLSAPDLKPLSSLAALSNSRTAHLDLDSVYDAPRAGDRMLLSTVTKLNGTTTPLLRPPGKADQNDLPREGRSEDPRTDRAARIGDPRNDENLIVSQLHVAFLKAHNALVAGGMNFEAARRAMRQRYQWIVLHDFLKQVSDETVLSDVVAYGPKFWKVEQPGKLFMPAEFAAAAYRFGHSMIRTRYDFNLNFPNATLSLLFTFTALTGQLGENLGLPTADTLPENWIIQWERILPTNAGKPQFARTIDARLTDFTFKLQDTFGKPEGEGNSNPEVVRVAPQLAIRNLLRGYLFGLPTGQAVARAMNITPLSGDAFLKALPNEEIRAKAIPFAERTPLWFYILAEAGDPAGAAGRHLGMVGSRIVVETFWNLIRHSEDSILQPGAKLDFDSFTLVDLINLAAKEDVQA
ncbi:hypothetical protein IVB22_28020 [Bradyrhizobium sp. 190]|uniref:peroxidase family protein n=1 Tax=Bradyrhizobium sp. 190 TaxID=2782658 RepID=UPI001FF9E8C6|nr:heme peroxidase family protein [Bradyrhizobium sp. 190]MCK1516287.1 hypothetical protein [Bradyrhizobium sp. 190]